MERIPETNTEMTELVNRLARLTTKQDEAAQVPGEEGAGALERRDIDALIEAARAIKAGTPVAYP